MSAANGWIGVDLDGTLAMYTHWQGLLQIGEPIPLMVDRVKAWLERGREVRIFTARVARLDAHELKAFKEALDDWLTTQGIQPLEVTCIKDMMMIEQWDDRVVQIIPNTGLRQDEHVRDLLLGLPSRQMTYARGPVS